MPAYRDEVCLKDCSIADVTMMLQCSDYELITLGN